MNVCLIGFESSRSPKDIVNANEGIFTCIGPSNIDAVESAISFVGTFRFVVREHRRDTTAGLAGVVNCRRHLCCVDMMNDGAKPVEHQENTSQTNTTHWSTTSRLLQAIGRNPEHVLVLPLTSGLVCSTSTDPNIIYHRPSPESVLFVQDCWHQVIRSVRSVPTLAMLRSNEVTLRLN